MTTSKLGLERQETDCPRYKLFIGDTGWKRRVFESLFPVPPLCGAKVFLGLEQIVP